MRNPSPFSFPSAPGGDAPPEGGLRSIQMIVFALFTGVVMFAIIATVAPVKSQGTVNGAMLRTVCVAMAAVTIPMSFLAQRVMLRSGEVVDDAGEPEIDTLFQRYVVSTIVACAMLEGTALFAVVVHMLTRDAIDLAIAAVPTILMAVAFFPTGDRWRRLVQGVRERHRPR